MTIFTSASVSAANRPVYQVDYEISEKGKDVKSGSVIVEEGMTEKVESRGDTDLDSLIVVVRPASKVKLSVDYRYKSGKDGKTIELAKTAVDLTPGTAESIDFKDSSGSDFRLSVKVTKK